MVNATIEISRIIVWQAEESNGWSFQSPTVRTASGYVVTESVDLRGQALAAQHGGIMALVEGLSPMLSVGDACSQEAS